MPPQLTIDPNHVVSIIMQSLASDEEFSLDQIENVVDGFLTGPFVSLVSNRNEIVSEILNRVRIRIGVASTLDDNGANHVPWLLNEDRRNWRLWPRLQQFLIQHESIPNQVVRELDQSTDKVLERIESPQRMGVWDRRGLVVGHVQSGKTTHYTSLAAKALDAGYQVVIVLAGVHNSLRSQTHERIDKHLIGRDSSAFVDALRRGQSLQATFNPIGVGEFSQRLGEEVLPFTIFTCTNSGDDGDFRTQTASLVGMQVSEGSRLVMVVKKHGTVLKNLIKWLRGQNTGVNVASSKINAPALIIDDEADHAGVNTERDPDADPKTINRRIRQLVSSFSRVAFVGYTATPFANIFIKPDEEDTPERLVDGIPLGKDLFPESFIVCLKPPSNYIGPEVVFGHEGDQSAGIPERRPLPMYVEISDSESWVPDGHKKDHYPGNLPPSLKEATRLFVLVCAVRSLRGDGDKHNSMLIHATRYIDVQNRLSQQVERELEIIRDLVLHGAPERRLVIMDELRDIFVRRLVVPHEDFCLTLTDTLPMPAWDSVWERLPDALEKVRVILVHGKSIEALEYSRRTDGLSAIVIGGDKLSRGLTLEGLSISYFLRASKMFDTLLQMGRWFGYRPRYADLCRVYTTRSLYNAFQEIALATTELMQELDSMSLAGKAPIDYGLKIRTPSDNLLITAANKIRSGKSVAVRFAGECVQSLENYYDHPQAENNKVAVRTFISQLGIRGKEKDAQKNFRWEGIRSQEVLNFLSGFEAISTPSFFQSCDPLRRYIQERSAQDELTTWTVVLVSKSTGEGGTVEIDETPVKLVQRGVFGDLGQTVRFRAVVSGDDESADLSAEERSRAIMLSGDTSVTVPRRECARRVRPENRGLLLIYLIEGTKVSPETGVKEVVTRPNDFVPAIAISFPFSPTAVPLEYTVNSVWRKHYGLSEEDVDE